MQADFSQRTGVVLLSGLFEPFECLGVVGLNTVAVAQHQAQGGFGIGIAQAGRLTQPAHSGRLVSANQAAAQVSAAQPVGRTRLAGIGGLGVAINRGLGVFVCAVAVLEAQAQQEGGPSATLQAGNAEQVVRLGEVFFNPIAPAVGQAKVGLAIRIPLVGTHLVPVRSPCRVGLTAAAFAQRLGEQVAAIRMALRSSSVQPQHAVGLGLGCFTAPHHLPAQRGLGAGHTQHGGVV